MRPGEVRRCEPMWQWLDPQELSCCAMASKQDCASPGASGCIGLSRVASVHDRAVHCKHLDRHCQQSMSVAELADRRATHKFAVAAHCAPGRVCSSASRMSQVITTARLASTVAQRQRTGCAAKCGTCDDLSSSNAPHRSTRLCHVRRTMGHLWQA